MSSHTRQDGPEVDDSYDQSSYEDEPGPGPESAALEDLEGDDASVEDEGEQPLPAAEGDKWHDPSAGNSQVRALRCSFSAAAAIVLTLVIPVPQCCCLPDSALLWDRLPLLRGGLGGGGPQMVTRLPHLVHKLTASRAVEIPGRASFWWPNSPLFLLKNF